VRLRNAASASFRVEIVREAFANGVHAPARMELRLKNGDSVPGPLEFPCCDESCKTCSEDDDALALSGPFHLRLWKCPARRL
jgi:hypothetical protein